MTAKPKLIYLVTEGGYFLSHRLPMARAAQAAGYDVAVITNPGQVRAAIEAEDIRVIPYDMERASLNPFRAIFHIRRLTEIYRQEKPDLVHHIAMKPVLYGSLAAWAADVRDVINAFAGLGYLFTENDTRAKAMRTGLIPVFRHILNRPGSCLLLQNPDDLALLRRLRIAPEDDGQIVVIPGSGVDLDACPVRPLPPAGNEFIFAFAGRMIGIKGLTTLKEAAAVLEESAPHVRIWLCGRPDPANPGSWTASQMEEFVANRNNVSNKGYCPDMAVIWGQVHAAVQPSWGGEGVPKSLLEAASCGRAIVATDVPGCRDMVQDGANGFLVPPRDAEALAAAMARLAGLGSDRCRVMGLESRKLVESRGMTVAAVMAQSEALYRRFL